MGRNKEVRIKLSEREYEHISGKARVMGLPISSFMRFISIEARIEVTADNTPMKYKRKKRLD